MSHIHCNLLLLWNFHNKWSPRVHFLIERAAIGSIQILENYYVLPTDQIWLRLFESTLAFYHLVCDGMNFFPSVMSPPSRFKRSFFVSSTDQIITKFHSTNHSRCPEWRRLTSKKALRDFKMWISYRRLSPSMKVWRRYRRSVGRRRCSCRRRRQTLSQPRHSRSNRSSRRCRWRRRRFS